MWKIRNVYNAIDFIDTKIRAKFVAVFVNADSRFQYSNL